MELAEDLECPVCIEYMLEEISLCRNGHSICRNCKNQLQHKGCPQCRDPFLLARNFALEKIVANTVLPCKNKGCKYTGKGDLMKLHKQQCLLSLLPCIFSYIDCHWKGRTCNLRDHIIQKHGDMRRTWVSHESLYTFLQFWDGDIFVVFMKIEGGKHIFVGMCMGLNRMINYNQYKAVLDYTDMTHSGYQLTVSAPCIPKCDISNVFKGPKGIVSIDMVNALNCSVGDIKVKFLKK